MFRLPLPSFQDLQFLGPNRDITMFQIIISSLRICHFLLFWHPLPPGFRWLDCRGDRVAVMAAEVVELEEIASGRR